MLIGISGLSANLSVTAGVKAYPAALKATSMFHGYTYRTPADEAVGIEVTVFRSPLGVAPEVIHYEVTDWWGFDTQGPTTSTLDRRQHDLAYLWDMGIPNASYDVPRNLLPSWRLANNPIGHKAVALRSAGTATWSVTVIEAHTGKRAEVTGEDIVNPEEFAFADIHFVDSTGGFSNAPATATTYTTFADALEGTRNTTSPQLIIIEDGQTHIAPPVTITSAYPSLRIRGRTPQGGATLEQDATQPYNATARAFSFTSHDPTKQKQFELINLNVVGHWDSTRESLKNGALNPSDLIKYSGDEACYQNILGCNISGWRAAIRNTTSSGRVICVYGTVITDWQDYGIYDGHVQSIPWSRTAIVNSEIVQHPHALCGGNKTAQPWHNNHGPYRTPNGSTMCYASYFFARNGWSAKSIDASSGIEGSAEGSRVWDANPCLRFGQAGARGASVMLRCCTIEGGGKLISISGANPERSDHPVNMILGQFIAVMGPRSASLLTLGYSGVTLEAFHAIRTRGEVISHHFEFQPLLFTMNDDTENANGETADPDALTDRVRFRSWTYLNERTDDEAYNGKSTTWTGLGALDVDKFADLKATNFVLHSTNAVEVPATEDGPINVISLNEFDVRFGALEKGYRDDAGDPQPSVLWVGNEPQFVPNSGSPAGSMVLAVPQEDSPAIEGETDTLPEDHAVYDLFKGLIAPAVQGYKRDRGAIILSR